MLFLRSRNSVAAISPAAKGMARSSIRPPTMPQVTSVVITPAIALGATSEETDSHSVSNRARSQRRRNDRGCAATVSALVLTAFQHRPGLSRVANRLPDHQDDETCRQGAAWRVVQPPGHHPTDLSLAPGTGQRDSRLARNALLGSRAR